MNTNMRADTHADRWRRSQTLSAIEGSSILRSWRLKHGPEARGLTPVLHAERKTRQMQARAYSGAQWNRTTADWVALATSSDAELHLALRALRSRSRELERNNEHVKGIFRTIVNNVVGKGIEMQAQIPMRRGNRLDERANDQIEALWRKWGRKKHCHTAGKMGWRALQRAVIKQVAMNGEALIRKIKQPFGDSPVPFALELIEADQLVDNWSGRTPDGNEIRMGVEVDEWQRPLAYWLYPKHPGDNMVYQPPPSSKFIRVPADEIIHVAVFDAPYQTRGIPWLHAALIKLRHVGGYEEAELVAARASASIMGIVQSPEPELPDADGGDLGEADDVMTDDRVYDLSPGVIKHLNPGETFTGFNPSRPNTGLDPFLRHMLRAVAVAIGASYETTSNDYSQSNYSSTRMSLLPERDNWRVIQSMLIEDFCQEVYESWLDQAVLAGAISAPAYELNPDLYANVRWSPRGWQPVDPWKETQANKENVRAGLATNQSILAQQGEDYEAVLKQRRRELDYAQQLGIVLDTDPSQVDAKGVAQPTQADPGTPGQPGQPSQGAGNDFQDPDQPTKPANTGGASPDDDANSSNEDES